MNTIKETTSDTYKALAAKIRASSTLEQLEQIDGKLNKFYQAGCLDTRGLCALDGLIIDQKIKLNLV